MPWPTPQDYNEALQSPQISFDDLELKNGQVATDKLGLPRPISGGFAIVYKMQCGNRAYAVRCFQREIPDQQERYAAISSHIEQAKLPYTVVFQYQAKGIRIRSQWYPIVKMEWISGQPLGTYIQQKLRDSNALLNLAASWMKMNDELRRASIAHGDLQDGNVLIVGDTIKLIDYDGMYVPKLAGRISSETGHRNYQHPQRTAIDFGDYLDNFSSWVIYISLIALAIDPTLWTTAKAGDECLLFRKSDFIDGKQSHVLNALARHYDTRLQTLAHLFESLLYLLPQQVPSLSVDMVGSQPTMSIPINTTPSTTASSNNSWLNDYLPSHDDAKSIGNASSQPQLIPNMALPTASPTWILDFISSPISRKNFTYPIKRPRSILAALITLIGLIPLFKHADVTLFSEPILGVIGCYIPFYFYRRDGAVLERFDYLNMEEAEALKLTQLEAEIKRLSVEHTALDNQEKRERSAPISERKAKTHQIEKETQQAKAILDQKLASINKRMGLVHQPVQQLQTTYQTMAAKTSQQIALLNNQQSTDLVSTLVAIQNQFVLDFLRSVRIDSAHISGIGPKMSNNLRYSGFVTAADITWSVQDVAGIGNSKGSSLMYWRQRLEAQARQKQPNQLSSAQLASVEAKYNIQRQNLMQQAQSEKNQFDQQYALLSQQVALTVDKLNAERTADQYQYKSSLQAITAKYNVQFKRLDQQEVAITGDYAKRRAELNKQIAETRKSMYDQNWSLAKVRQQINIYSNVTFKKYLRYLITGRAN